MDHFLTFLLGLLLGALSITGVIAFALRFVIRELELKLPPAGTTSTPNGLLRSADQGNQPPSAAGTAANDADGRGEDQLFSDLVPSMGRTAANDPGPEGYPTRFPRPCRACEKTRALALAALHRAGVRRAYTHTH